MYTPIVKWIDTREYSLVSPFHDSDPNFAMLFSNYPETEGKLLRQLNLGNFMIFFLVVSNLGSVWRRSSMNVPQIVIVGSWVR